MPHAKHSSAQVQAAIKELQVIEASRMEIETWKLQLYAELEMKDKAEQEVDGQNVIKTLAQVQEEDSEDFSFSVIDAEGSEEEEEKGEDEGKDEDEKDKEEEEEEECVVKKHTEGAKGQIKKAVCIPCSPCHIKILIGTQKRLKAGKVQATLDAMRNDLHSGSKRKLTASESSQR